MLIKKKNPLACCELAYYRVEKFPAIKLLVGTGNS